MPKHLACADGTTPIGVFQHHLSLQYLLKVLEVRSQLTELGCFVTVEETIESHRQTTSEIIRYLL